MREREPVRISFVRVKTPAQGVRTRHTSLQRYVRRSNAFQTSQLLYDAQTAWGRQLSGNLVFPSLVVPGRSEPALRQWFGGNTCQEPIKRKIKIQTSLFTVGDHVQTCVHLILHCDSHRVVQHFA